MSVVARGASANPAHATRGPGDHPHGRARHVGSRRPGAQESRGHGAHRFSAAVWTIWLIPYFCGMFMGIPAIDLTPNGAFGATGAIGFVLHLRGDKRAA